MAKARFFSNSIIKLDHTENEIMSSLRGTRTSPQATFTVPEHTVGTNNLMIFIDGRIIIRDRDYTDINSNNIQLTNPIDTNVDFHAILVKTSKDEHIDIGVETVKWESF